MRPFRLPPVLRSARALPFLIALFCLIWSSAFAVAKIGMQDCPPLLLLTIRFLIAGVVILAANALTGGFTPGSWRLSVRDLMALAVLGAFNNALYLGLSYFGLREISAGLSALIVSCNPILTALLAAALLGEPMTWRKATGLLLGIGGVTFIVQERLALGSDSGMGMIFSVAALLALVAGTILFKQLAPNGGLWVGNGVQNLAAGLVLVPFALTFESVDAIVPSGRLLAVLLYVVIAVSVLGYLLWFHLLTVSGASAASAYHFLMPPLGILFGWLLLGEQIGFRDLIGIVPVAIGIYLVTRPARKPAAVPRIARRPA